MDSSWHITRRVQPGRDGEAPVAADLNGIHLGDTCDGVHKGRPCRVWGGDVTENQLGQPVCLTVPPVLQDVGDALIYFRSGLVRQSGIYNPLVQAQLAAIRRVG